MAGEMVASLSVVLGCCPKTSLLGAPGTSVKVPKLGLLTPLVIVLVPVSVMLPVANGVPAVGRTRMFCHVREFLIEFAVCAVTVKVIVVAVLEVIATEVPVATSLMLFPLVVQGLVKQPTNTLGTIPPVSNTNPDGALRMSVPIPICAVPFSARTGPVSEV